MVRIDKKDCSDSVFLNEGMFLNSFKCLVFTPLVEKKVKSEKPANVGPQFSSGVIVKITDNKPLPARKFIKVQ